MNRETVRKIVKASGVSAGELVLVHFWGDDAGKGIANDFVAAVAELGASPLLLQQSREINRDVFSTAGECSFGEKYFRLFDGFDAVLDIFAYRPIVLGDDIGEGQYERYRSYMRSLFGKLMEAKRFTQIRIPTHANADDSPLETEDYISRMNAAYDVDYEAVDALCRQELRRIEGARRVMLRSGDGCRLSLELGERPWHTDSGDGDLPCGEIYIAPKESSAEGTVFFDRTYLEGKMYTDVEMRFEHGRLLACSETEIWEYFAALPEENRVLCELGLGMNPNVKSLCGYTLLDEKMGGTFHIALGANTMFGGANKASDHIDFVGMGEVEARE